MVCVWRRPARAVVGRRHKETAADRRMRRALAAADQRRIAVSTKRAALMLEYGGNAPTHTPHGGDDSDGDDAATVEPPRTPAAQLSRKRRLCLLELGSLSTEIVNTGVRSGAFRSEDVAQLSSESVVALFDTPPHRKRTRRRP